MMFDICDIGPSCAPLNDVTLLKMLKKQTYQTRDIMMSCRMFSKVLIITDFLENINICNSCFYSRRVCTFRMLYKCCFCKVNLNFLFKFTDS